MTPPEEIFKTIGTRMSALRAARGITPEQLADDVGMTRWKITLIERGKARLSAAEFVQLAAALHVTTSVLAGEEKFSHFMDRIEAAHDARAGAQ